MRNGFEALDLDRPPGSADLPAPSGGFAGSPRGG